jgi:hypothetical protein
VDTHTVNVACSGVPKASGISLPVPIPPELDHIT